MFATFGLCEYVGKTKGAVQLELENGDLAFIGARSKFAASMIDESIRHLSCLSS